jgi:hypothetical protein
LAGRALKVSANPSNKVHGSKKKEICSILQARYNDEGLLIACRRRRRKQRFMWYFSSAFLLVIMTTLVAAS